MILAWFLQWHGLGEASLSASPIRSRTATGNPRFLSPSRSTSGDPPAPSPPACLPSFLPSPLPPSIPPAAAVPGPGSACRCGASPLGGSIAHRVPPPAGYQVNPPPLSGEPGLRWDPFGSPGFPGRVGGLTHPGPRRRTTPHTLIN